MMAIHDGPNVLDSVYDVRPENALNHFIRSRKRNEKVERDAADLFAPKPKARGAPWKQRKQTLETRITGRKKNNGPRTFTGSTIFYGLTITELVLVPMVVNREVRDPLTPSTSTGGGRPRSTRFVFF